MTGLRIMTYNVRRARPDAVGLDAVLTVIAEAAPDIVALQEIDVTDLHALGQRLGMQAFVSTARCGNAFLSYYPLHHLESFTLGQGGRCLRAEIDFGQKRMHLYNVRLEGGRWHREQIETLLGRDLLGDQHKGIPALILGDFADHLSGGINLQLLAALRRISKPLLHGTYPSWFPFLTRDRAYILGDLRVLAAEVVRGRAARLASSHLPFLLTVQITDPRQYLKIAQPFGARKLEIAPG